MYVYIYIYICTIIIIVIVIIIIIIIYIYIHTYVRRAVVVARATRAAPPAGRASTIRSPRSSPRNTARDCFYETANVKKNMIIITLIIHIMI